MASKLDPFLEHTIHMALLLHGSVWESSSQTHVGGWGG